MLIKIRIATKANKRCDVELKEDDKFQNTFS